MPDRVLLVVALTGLVSVDGAGGLISQLLREPAKRKERKLWTQWGTPAYGTPTIRWLRHDGVDIENRAKASELRKKVAARFQSWRCLRLPTPTEQLNDPEQADKKYDQIVKILLEATRDSTQFPLVASENANYGFRRNLWFFRNIGLPVTVICLAGIIFLLCAQHELLGLQSEWAFLPDETEQDATKAVLLLRVFSSVLLALLSYIWVRKITPDWVKEASNKYTKCLLSAASRLSDKQIDPTEKQIFP